MLIDKVQAALRSRIIRFETVPPAIIDEEAGTWLEPSNQHVLQLRHHSHGHVTLVVTEGDRDTLATILRVGGEDWSELENTLAEVMLAEVNK